MDHPEGVKADDIEVVLLSAQENILVAVAVMDWRPGMVQEAEGITTPTSGFLQTNEHIWLLYETGLNTGPQYSTKVGVTAKTIYRALDDQKRDERTIRRYLDGPAFRDRQRSHSIVVARAISLRINALKIWNLQEPSILVVKVPLSKVLLIKIKVLE